MAQLDAGRLGGARERAWNGGDPAPGVEGADAVDQRGHEGHGARRLVDPLSCDVCPDGDRVDERRREPGAGKDGAERAQEEAEVAPRARAQHVRGARPRAVQQRLEAAVDTARRGDEGRVARAAPRPPRLERLGGALEVGLKRDPGPVRAGDLVHLLDAAELDVIAELQAEGAERPLETRPVEEDVGPGVEREAVRDEARGEPPGLGARLEHADAEARARQAQRGREPAHPGADDDDRPGHRGNRRPRKACRSFRPARSARPGGATGGKASSSISGTKSVPRPLPKT